MQYMLAIYEDEANFPGGEDGEAWRAVLGKHMAFAGALAQAGVPFSGQGLHLSHSATTVRTAADGAVSVHDGPFAETRELLGGFYVIDVPDLDAAIGWAKQLPLGRHGAVEVRPVLGMPA
jgi:hypothetical protein